MSAVSRAELETMDRDELVETIVELSDRVADLEMRADMAGTARESIRDEIAEIVERNERLEAENQSLRNQLDEIEATAEQAMTVASAGHDPSTRSKTEAVKHVTRNTLVVRAIRGSGSMDKPLTVSDVRDKLEGEIDNLQWQIVRNAWDQLQDEWPQFYDTQKDGQQACSIKAGDVTTALARAVEHDLGRDDLTKRFVGDNGGDGA